MHRELKQLLSVAKGESRLVVVVFLDVRGFSSFAKIAESSEAALFLRSIYTKILDNYFPSTTFFKPTGDGLLIILDYDETNLTDIVNTAVKSSLQLVDDFADLTLHDPMVNFQVPDSLGIGLARGAATALISGDKVLDYSGRPLNLASRLMDLARPRGVVFSETLGWDLLEDEYAEQFKSDKVYVKGLAEDQPMTVYIAEDMVALPESSKRPINRYEREATDEQELTFKQLQERGKFLHELPSQPALTDNITAYVRYPKATATGRRNPSLHSIAQFSAEYVERRGKYFAGVQYKDVVQRLSAAGVKPTWPVRIFIEFSRHAEVE
jgi:class 3 adenylate cyclase